MLHDASGVAVAKVPSTPSDQSEGILAGIDRLGATPADLARFAHGTTVATNTVLERDGARVVLVVTAGFRDLLTIGRQHRPALYDLRVARPAPLVAPPHVVEVTERLDDRGEVVEPLTEDEVARVAEAVAAQDPDAVAVCLLHAYRTDTHERRLADAIARSVPDVPVSLSSAVLPTFREVERASTTVLNAYVAPRMGRYLDQLGDRLDQRGHQGTVEVMQSGGGTFTATVAARQPVHTLLSGPAAGAWGAAAVGRATGAPDAIAFDMGGTSTDVTLVRDGRPAITAEGEIDGLAFGVPTTDIHTVGAGGGSIAWVDDGGALRVGPRSAGAEPGPACYGHGGRQPTVTDANVHLGRLDPDTLLGGTMPLDAAAATHVLGELADLLDLGVDATALGVLRVVEAAMVRALRVVSVERGHDPRQLVLIPFGGAGALHQAAVAADLGCRRVVVPPHAGVLSALGLLAAPLTATGARTVLTPLDAAAVSDLDRWWDDLEAAATAELRQQGTDAADAARTADLRYRGQAYELSVPADNPADPGQLAADFHRAHADRYGFDQPDTPVELVTVRVRAEAAVPELPLPRWTGGGAVADATRATRELVVDGDTRRSVVPVLEREALAAGAQVRGPAVVAGLESTCWVAPWQELEVDDLGAMHLQEAGT